MARHDGFVADVGNEVDEQVAAENARKALDYLTYEKAFMLSRAWARSAQARRSRAPY